MLRAAVAANPYMRVVCLNGYYDLVSCSYPLQYQPIWTCSVRVCWHDTVGARIPFDRNLKFTGLTQNLGQL
jgi:hypothetical protein